ncbi:helix-turn-helix domain-containing protein [Rasiella sp. SM2506]|uniref:helix-turn-helix domain-containing protein n=1 Tax=Rasiella sp. SM2506 TaxID=3423914 RepID=UPI003D79E2A6
MKQPALGQRILALRQEKGLTQEELVAQCNISVRTIQRIEAGEVVPRSYTVRTILSALGEDFENFTETRVESGLKKAFFLKIDDTKQANFLTKHLKIAWIAGIVYFVLGFAEIPADAYHLFVYEPGSFYPNYIYIPLKLTILASIILFLRGFILSGNILNNYLLKIVVFIMLVFNIVYYALDIAALYYKPLNDAPILILESISFGIVGVLMGIAMLRFQKALGNIAIVTGIFEIVTYAFFSSIVFALGGFLLLNVTIILEIIILYKVAQLVKEKMNE